MRTGPTSSSGNGSGDVVPPTDGETAERLRQVFRSTGAAMGLVGLDGTWLAATDRLCELLRTDTDTLLALSPRDLIHPDDRPAAVRATRLLLEGGVDSVDAERRYLRADGGVLHARVATTLLRDPDGRPDSFLTQLLDTEDDSGPVPLERQVSGLVGADTFLAHVDRALERSRRAGRTVLLVHVELDDTGTDPVLAARLRTCAAQRLVGTVRGGDMVAALPARLTVCCEGLVDEADVPTVVRRLHGTLTAAVEVDGQRHLLPVAVTAAVAGRGETADELLARPGWPVDVTAGPAVAGPPAGVAASGPGQVPRASAVPAQSVLPGRGADAGRAGRAGRHRAGAVR
ncbi:PAS domain S-box protein [Aquipuribacter nitratireducens]|uniref:PAS domain S-box protein n=1 Tax=Aquipuribacter nitratireducens TaxID=650104 RepID=A0ABW0GK99_9MICO